MELSIFSFLHDLTGQSALLDWLVVFFGKYSGYFLLAAALVFVWQEKDWKSKLRSSSIFLLAVILSRGLIAEIIRFFYFRPRPFAALGFEPLINHAASEAFPSGHATFFFALAFAMYFLNKTWGTWFIGVATLIGLARVVAGTHWPLDILGGAVVALISVLVVKFALQGTFTQTQT